MNIQIDHTSFNNLGAELMHDAIIKAVKSRYPDARFIAGKTLRKSQSAKLKKSGILPYNINNPLKRFIAKQLNKTKFESWNYGLLLNDDIDVVFDAGGFRFGDQWMHNASKNEKLERYYNMLKKRGVKIFFLPQAFGPFEKPASIEAVKILLKYADLIYARDNESFNYLNAISPNSKRIKITKDFTIDLSGIEKNDKNTNRVCIIPNKRMITHVDQKTKENYLNTVVELILLLNKKDFEVSLMSFCDAEDLKICETIRGDSDLDIPVYSNLSASDAKSIIKSCYVVFSSRYHGVVSALNQNVPCMSSSWSHKYEELLIGYRMGKFLTGNNTNETIHIFNELLDRTYNNDIRIHLQGINTENYKAINEMWEQVFSLVE